MSTVVLSSHTSAFIISRQYDHLTTPVALLLLSMLSSTSSTFIVCNLKQCWEEIWGVSTPVLKENLFVRIIALGLLPEMDG
ncbi:MAG TPA: hypothetical protein VK203_26205 [Nostocaceae cyanobacterium]|nr:hypothetical protein [Nostocaceae cyanobacterium]